MPGLLCLYGKNGQNTGKTPPKRGFSKNKHKKEEKPDRGEELSGFIMKKTNKPFPDSSKNCPVK